MCFLGGIPIADYTMDMAINCCCFLNRMDCGFSVLGSFFKRCYMPDVITFSTLLKGLFQENRMLEAQELFRKITYENLCHPNEVMFGTIIDGLCKVGSIRVAIEFIRIMEIGKCKPNTVVYSTIIDSLCKDKILDEALDLFTEMIDKGISPNVITCSFFIQGLCNNGKWKEVENLWVRMIDLIISPNVYTYNMVVDALCNEGKI